MNTKTDELVLTLFNKVKDKQKEIEKAERPKYLTNCSLGTEANNLNTRVNLQAVSDTAILVDLYAFILTKSEAYRQAASLLQLPIPKWMGYTFSDWLSDIKARAAQVGVNAKKKELQDLEKRLDALISTEQRRELELEEIQNLLK